MKTASPTGMLLLMKQEAWQQQVLAFVQLLKNFTWNAGPFPSSKVLAFTFIFITLQLQDGCPHVQISLSYSRPEGELRCQPLWRKQSFLRTPPADLCLHFIVTWALPAGLEPGKARDRSIKIGLDESRQAFSITGQIVHILGSAGHTVSFVITPACHSSLKATIDNT